VSEAVKRVLSVALLAIAIASAACSPEANRVRGGGPGADVGNHSDNSPEPSTAPKT